MVGIVDSLFIRRIDLLQNVETGHPTNLRVKSCDVLQIVIRKIVIELIRLGLSNVAVEVVAQLSVAHVLDGRVARESVEVQLV